jgi:hypothetical protein
MPAPKLAFRPGRSGTAASDDSREGGVGSVRSFLLALALAVFVCASIAAPSSSGGTGLFVGVDEDAVKWGRAQLTASIARAVGLKAIRVTVAWSPGETALSAAERAALDRAVVGSWGMRVVVAVYGRPDAAPQDDFERSQYCDYTVDLLRQYPTVNDVVIWNEPNVGAFWRPQFNPDGSSAAPASYAALLSRCWQTLHAARPAVNVIASSASRGGDDPTAFEGVSHSPAAWYRQVGAAYRAGGFGTPLFDTIGHNPYPNSSAERPWARHADPGTIGQGDYERLIVALTEAFGGTAQPLPGQGAVTIWYVEQGFQTAIDPRKAHLYTGSETDRFTLPPWSNTDSSREGPAPDQATQVADAIRVAYCQPYVGAYFNFLLADEPSLAGWQSGILWADWSPKLSYSAFKRAVAEVNAGTVPCSAFSKTGAPPIPATTPPSSASVPLAIADLRVSSTSAFSATLTWRTTIPASSRIAYGLPESGPSLWTTVRGVSPRRTATLSGLSFATTYRVWVTAVSDDGQRSEETLDFTTRALPDSPAAAIGRPAGVLLLDGQPFFPLIVWSQCPDTYDALLAAGINLFALNPCGGLQVQLDALAGRALSSAVGGQDGGSGSGLVGYFHPDEPDGLGMTAAMLPPPAPGVPTRPRFLTLTNHFYSGAAPLPWGRDMYPGFIAASDVVGFDLYPLQEWCRPERLADVYSSQLELVRMASQKPTFQWIEAAEWKCPGGATAITPAVVRAESWLAIAGGAHGLGFFPSQIEPSIRAAIARVSRDIAKLGPALLSLPVPSGVESGDLIRVGARSHGGALYVIAVNAGFTPVRATIRVAGLGGRVLNVLDENRQIGASGDVFTDGFDPLGVHLYVLEPPEN